MDIPRRSLRAQSVARVMKPVIDLSIGHIRFGRHLPSVTLRPSAEYGSASGSQLLKEVLAEMHGLPQECITITSGSSLGISSTLASRRPRLLLLPRPYFPSFTRIAKLLGLDYAFYSAVASEGMADVDSAVAAMRAYPSSTLIWNYPHNPTGAVDSEEARAALRKAALDTGGEVLLDCVYSDLVFSEYSAPSGVPPELEVRIYSLSKSLALAGERIGYVVASPPRCEEVARAHWALAMCPPAGSQSMALDVLTSGYDRRVEILEQLRDRRDMAMAILEDSPYVIYTPPRGGIFLWIETPGVGVSSLEMAAICRKAGLLVEPGSLFGTVTPTTLRVSLAVERRELEKGLSLLAAVSHRLSNRES